MAKRTWLSILALWFCYVSFLTLSAFMVNQEPTQAKRDASPFFHNVVTHIDELHPLARWDSVWYLSISKHGYGFDGFQGMQNTHFFPLYSFAMGVASYVFYVSDQTAGLWISRLSLLGILFLLWLIYREENKEEPWPVLVSLLAFPMSFIFITIYSEAFFLFLVLGSVWSYKKKKFGWSFVAGVLAGLTRIHALALGVYLFIYAFQNRRKGVRNWKEWAASLGSGVGVLIFFLGLKIKTGEFGHFFSSHAAFFPNRPEGIFNIIAGPWAELNNLLKHTVGFGSLYYLIGYVSLGILIAAGIYFGRKKKWPELGLLGSYLVLSLGVGSMWGLPRYMITVFPIFFLAPKLTQKPVAWYSILFLGIFLQAFQFINFVNFGSPAP